MGMAIWRAAVTVALVACAAFAAFGCRGGDDRLSVEEFAAKGDAVCASERRAARQAMNVEAYLRSRRRIRADYGGLQPPERYAAAFREFLRGFDEFTRAKVLILNDPRALATLREAAFAMGDEPTDDIPEMVRSLRRGLRKAERILNQDEQLAGLFVTQDLAEARVEVARLRLPLQCGEKLTSGEKLTRGMREARVHNSVALMCLLYDPKVLAKALDVGASANEVARALRQLTGLPRVEPACLEGFAFQRGPHG